LIWKKKLGVEEEEKKEKKFNFYFRYLRIQYKINQQLFH